VRIPFALATIAGLLHSTALAQTVPAPDKLEPIVVSATRTASRVDQLVADVTVLSRSDIEKSEGRTLVELLSQQPGIQFSSNGGLGKSASLFIRGLEARHTLLLIDGVRVSSATLGTPSLDNLPMEIIDRIEIVRGPMSALYGSNAMGGVIQIFTRSGRAGLHPNASVMAGTNAYGKLSGGVAYGHEGLDVAIQLQRTVTDGFSTTNDTAQFGNYNPDKDGFRQTGGSLNLGLQLAQNWRLEALAISSSGNSAFDDGPKVDSRAKLSNGLQSLRLQGQITPSWLSKLSASKSVDKYDTLSSASQFTQLGVIETDQTQLSWENSIDTPFGTALALLERLKQKVSRPGDAFSVSDRSINGIGLGLNGSSGDHSWQASLRMDDNSQFGKQNTGALGWGYALTSSLRLGASYGTSFTAPSFNQLYYPGFGNPTLLPEDGKHAELSLRWKQGAQSLKAALFDNRYRNFISSGPAPSNTPRARSEGLSLAYEISLQTVKLSASLDHVNPHNATDGVATSGNLLPRRAKDSFKLQGDWELGNVNLGASLNSFSHRFDDAANKYKLAGYATLDLRSDWQFAPAWSLNARLNNVADKQYETARGFNQPGREFFLGLRYEPQ
jgi:vitamin B12 transporter